MQRHLEINLPSFLQGTSIPKLGFSKRRTDCQTYYTAEMRQMLDNHLLYSRNAADDPSLGTFKLAMEVLYTWTQNAHPST